MPIPSGSGTEVLKRHIIDGLGNSQTEVIGGEANHIYTIISIVVFAHTTANFEIIVKPSGGANLYMVGTSVPANDTFVFNDKFCLTGTDELTVNATSGSCDVVTTYIDQDWE